MSAGRDSIFAQLDDLIAEGPQDEWDTAESRKDSRAEREYIRSLIREAGLIIDVETVCSRLERGWSLHDAIHKPMRNNGKLGVKRSKQ